jgi:signal peptidase I
VLAFFVLESSHVSVETIKPRHPLGLVAIALLFGAPALMLWMGRFRLSVLYTSTIILLIFALLAGASYGFVPIELLPRLSLGTILSVLTWLVAFVALVHSFQLNKLTPVRKWYSRWFVALPAYSLVFVTIAFAARTFLLQPFDIPSSSNEPSLMRGDVIFVSKLAYRSDDPQRGDIAVFKLPSDPSIDYIKRIIGLPGDRIQMKQGIVYLNGEPLKHEREYLYSPEPTVTFYRETLPNGRSYVVADVSPDSPVDNTDIYEVPEGHYFAMGDNRDNSRDSRYLDHLGYIPRANFVGRYAFRFWNSSGISLTVRPKEIFPKQ